MKYEYNPDPDYYYQVHFFSQDLKACVATEMRIGEFDYLLFRYDKQIRDTGAPILILSVILPFEPEDMRHVKILFYKNKELRARSDGLAEILAFQYTAQKFLDFISFNTIKLKDLYMLSVFGSDRYQFPCFNHYSDRCLACEVGVEGVVSHVKNVYGWDLLKFSSSTDESKVLFVFNHGLFALQMGSRFDGVKTIFIFETSKPYISIGDLELVHKQDLVGLTFFRHHFFLFLPNKNEFPIFDDLDNKLFEYIDTLNIEPDFEKHEF